MAMYWIFLYASITRYSLFQFYDNTEKGDVIWYTAHNLEKRKYFIVSEEMSLQWLEPKLVFV